MAFYCLRGHRQRVVPKRVRETARTDRAPWYKSACAHERRLNPAQQQKRDEGNIVKGFKKHNVNFYRGENWLATKLPSSIFDGRLQKGSERDNQGREGGDCSRSVEYVKRVEDSLLEIIEHRSVKGNGILALQQSWSGRSGQCTLLGVCAKVSVGRHAGAKTRLNPAPFCKSLVH